MKKKESGGISYHCLPSLIRFDTDLNNQAFKTDRHLYVDMFNIFCLNRRTYVASVVTRGTPKIDFLFIFVALHGRKLWKFLHSKYYFHYFFLHETSNFFIYRFIHIKIYKRTKDLFVAIATKF